MPFVDAAGLRLRYRECGAGRPGAPFLFVHGAGMSSTVFLSTLRRLSRRRRAVALDLPGHGRSDPGGGSVEGLAASVAAAAAALGLERPILVGHSLGGQVALVLGAAGFAGRLALVTTAARIPIAAETFDAIARPRYVEYVTRALYAPTTPAEIRRQSAALSLHADPEQTAADFRLVAGFDGGPLLAAVRVPTLVVAGARDRVVPAALAAELAAGVAGARLELLAHSGHMPMHEEPAAFTALLLGLAA